MKMHTVLFALALLPAAMPGQQPAATAERVAGAKVEPEALQILRSVTDALKNVQTFTFHAVIRRELQAANGETTTFVRNNDVAISRPGRMRINITAQQERVEVYFTNGELFLYAPAAKEFVGLGTSSLNLDTMVDQLEKANIVLPMAPLFRSDPYRNLVDGLESATVLGRTEIDGKSYQHLGFRKPDVEWQLWVEDSPTPLPRRAQATYQQPSISPRLVIDFSDWNLMPDLPAEYYVFTRPAEAKAVPAIDMDALRE
jgi:hypothetical protein